MTRKHFEDLAKRLASMKPTDRACSPEAFDKAYGLWEWFCEETADFCESHNDNFNRKRFLEACEYTN